MSEEEKKAITLLYCEVKHDLNSAMSGFDEMDRRAIKIVLNLIKKQSKEIETYKKIAEKLAIEVENLDDMLSAELGSHTRGYCKIENSCILNHKRKCSECIIDWARKEVEKDV